MAAAPEPGPDATWGPTAPHWFIARLLKWASRLTRTVCMLLFKHHPGAALRLNTLMCRVVAKFRQPLTAAALAKLLGEPLAPRHQVLVRQIATNHYCKDILGRSIRRHGLAPVTRVLRWTGRDRLLALHRGGRPAIIAITHLGYPKAILAAFSEAGVPLMFVAGSTAGFELPAGMRVLSYHGEPEARALWLKAGLDQLKRGGLLGLAIDHTDGPAAEGPGVFGSSWRLRRGISALHRLTRAPVVPVTTLWGDTGCGFEVIVGEPLPAPDPSLPGPEIEAAMQRTLLGWLEAHIRAHPGELQPKTVLRYAGGP